MENDKLYEEALEAINKLFSDSSMPQSTCRENLENLIDEIQVLLDSLED